MEQNEQPRRVSEDELIGLAVKVLRASGVDHVECQPKIGTGLRPDLIVRGPKTRIIEVKAVTPQTSRRLLDAVEKLQRYGSRISETEGTAPELVLLVPETLSGPIMRRIEESGVTIYDRTWLLDEARSVNLLGEALNTLEPDPKQRAALIQSQFAGELAAISAGKGEWRLFQRLCLDIFNHLFCPPLSNGLWEHENASGVNRRDIIMPNYSTVGFWYYLRQMYRADHIVIDAKNYVESISKEEVLQLANYLSYHGTGLFGLIVTRSGDDSAARHIRREQWMMHNKLILVLNDDDLNQMLTNHDTGVPPESLLQQKIEDFRLAI